jgi:hypothetical protein
VSYVCIGKILPMPKPKFMQRANSGREQFRFKQPTNIHLMLLHEADYLMLLQGIVKSPDIPAVNDHSFAGEGEALPLRPRCLWLRVLTPHWVATSSRGTFTKLPTTTVSPVVVAKIVGREEEEL